MKLADETSLVVIQPSPFCNINCSYCYLPQRSDRTRLSIGQLRTMVEKLLTFPTIKEHLPIVWHAGEPLVLGIDYYREAFECIRALMPEHVQVSHSFQTNGMLLDDAWCAFITEWNVSIGISIDGPAAVHDAFRKTRSGKGTFEQTIAGLRTLQRNSVSYYVISVLTRAALADPSGMLDFYRAHDIADVGFNVEEEEGLHKTSSLADIDGPAFKNFLQRFTARMEEVQFPIAVREFEETLAAIQGHTAGTPRSSQIEPFGIVSIDVRGNVYTFSPELVGYSSADFPTFAIGNIFTDSFEKLSGSTTLAKMARQIDDGVAMCEAGCDYFPVCGGGTPGNKVFENGTFASAETMACRLNRKHVTDFVLGMIETRYPVRDA
jgi:uncharacterized protein